MKKQNKTKTTLNPVHRSAAPPAVESFVPFMSSRGSSGSINIISCSLPQTQLLLSFLWASCLVYKVLLQQLE